jgi:O-antigen ligase
VRSIACAILLAAVALLTGAMVAQITPVRMLVYICAVVIFTVSFIRIDWGLYLLIFSMLLSPEFIAGDTASTSLGRGVTLRLEDFLLVLIGASWFARNAVMKELGLFLKTPLNKPILFYMLTCVLSTGFGFMAGRVELKTGLLYVLKYFEYFIVFFMLVNHVRTGAQLKRFVFCLFLTAFVVSVIGILQIPGGERVSAPFEGPVGEPNTFGGYLLFVGMVAAGMAAKTRERKTRHLLLLLIACMLPPFFFTQSRSSYLAFVPALLVLGFMTERRLIIVGLVSVGLLLSPLFLPTIVKNRILYTFNQPEEPGQITIGELRLDTSTSARLQSWQEALGDFSKHPLLGHGVTGYAFVDAQVPRVLAETGLLGFFAFIYLLYSVFRLTLQRLRQTEDPYYKGLIMGFTAGFIGLVVHSLGTNTFILVRIMEPFWFFAGVIAVLPAIEAGQPAGPEEAAGRPKPALRSTPGSASRRSLFFPSTPGKETPTQGKCL